MTTPSTKSSAVLVRNMLVQPQAATGVGTVRWSSPSPAAVTSGGDDSRHTANASLAALARGGFAAPAAALYDDAERQRLVTALLDLEITKNKEVDHLRLRVAQLTKRNGELEAALSTVHTALEEEAAAALGSQRRAEQALLGRCVQRWKWRAIRRRAAAVAAASWQLMEGTRAALDKFPASGADDASRLVRKAMEELTWAEKQWSDDRLSYVQQSVDHFLHGIGDAAPSMPTSSTSAPELPLHSTKPDARSSPQRRGVGRGAEREDDATSRALADVVKLARRLTDRCDAMVTARLQLLQATFLNVGKAEEARVAVANALDLFLRTPGGRHLQSAYAECEDNNHREGADGGGSSRALPLPSTTAAVAATRGDALRLAAQYDVLRDSTNALVSTIILPPAVALLRSSTAHDRLGSTVERRAVVAALMDATEAMLLQHPLSLKVDAALKDFSSRHIQWRAPPARVSTTHHNEEVDVALAGDAERVAATFCLQRSPATWSSTSTPTATNLLTGGDRVMTPTQRVREILYDRPNHGSQQTQPTLGGGGATRPKTPSRPLRWDLVHSILDAPGESHAAVGARRHAAGGGNVASSTAATPNADVGAQEATTEGRLQSARRRLLAVTSRNALL